MGYPQSNTEHPDPQEYALHPSSIASPCLDGVNGNATISMLAEIPEDLHKSLKSYLDGHPDWDQDRIFAAALSLFLLQNGDSNTPDASLNYQRAARVYLETLFRYSL